MALKLLSPQCHRNGCLWGILPLRLGIRQFPTIQTKAPPSWGTKGHVGLSPPVTSCWGLKVAVSVTYPSSPCPVLLQGDLQVLLLQESSQGDLHYFKSNVGWKGEIKILDGHSARAWHLSFALQSTGTPMLLVTPDAERLQRGIESLLHTLDSEVKSQSGISSVLLIRKCQAQEKTIFFNEHHWEIQMYNL